MDRGDEAEAAGGGGDDNEDELSDEVDDVDVGEIDDATDDDVSAFCGRAINK